METDPVIPAAAASRRCHQVCVFGAGPAGLAVAARLLDSGRDVVIFQRAPAPYRWGGESFTGAIRAPLATLGMWETFRSAGHVEAHERQWAWGGEPKAASTIFEPHGALWHVDRSRFDADLRRAVIQRHGVIQTYRTLSSVTRIAGKWQIELDGRYACTADYMVDATGRTRALARRLDASIVSYDRLIGLTALASHEERGASIRSMLVASIPSGWWYTSPTPKGHIVAVFSDPDLVDSQLRRQLRPVAANSTLARIRPDEGWSPVGDAYASHDPLCGWGVCRALENGILLADSIDFWLSHGSLSRLRDFHRHCGQQYAAYLAGLKDNYLMEQRWPSAPFWQRRHQSAIH